MTCKILSTVYETNNPFATTPHKVKIWKVSAEANQSMVTIQNSHRKYGSTKETLK
jgi:hypothetical protein